MSNPVIETFADVLHTIVDHVLDGDVAAKAHAVIDQASGTRTPAPEPEPAEPPEPPEAPETAPEAAPDAEAPPAPETPPSVGDPSAPPA